jgi:hypothetical protein
MANAYKSIASRPEVARAMRTELATPPYRAGRGHERTFCVAVVFAEMEPTAGYADLALDQSRSSLSSQPAASDGMVIGDTCCSTR